MSSINLSQAFEKIEEPWAPVEVARVNDHVVNAAIFEGEYPGGFHSHAFDEMFSVQEGEIVIQMKEQPDITLKAGECATVPWGVEHCPKSESKAKVLMFEPS